MSDDTSYSNDRPQPRRNPKRSSRSVSASTSSLIDPVDVATSTPRIVAPRSNSGVSEQLVPAMGSVNISDSEESEIQILSWEKDGYFLNEFADIYQLAKDIPHELQDRINAMKDFARRSDQMQVTVFETMMSENKSSTMKPTQSQTSRDSGIPTRFASLTTTRTTQRCVIRGLHGMTI